MPYRSALKEYVNQLFAHDKVPNPSLVHKKNFMHSGTFLYNK